MQRRRNGIGVIAASAAFALVVVVAVVPSSTASARTTSGARHAAPVRIGGMPRASGSRAASLSPSYIVQTSDLAAQQRLVAWAADHGVAVTAEFGSAIFGATLSLPPSLLAKVKSLPGVVTVEKNGRVHATGVENSPPWGLDRIDQRSPVLDNNYHYTTDGTGVKAYVIDTGINFSSNDFGSRILPGAYYDFGDGTMASDCAGHGTHTAGTLGGTTYGVAKGVSIVPVKVLDCSGQSYADSVLLGMQWVVDNHNFGEPAVASMSIGGPWSPSINSGVQSMIDDGITVVVAAGNDTQDACNYSPASAPSAITVGAVDWADTEATFSNYGPCVDIFAPGVTVLSDWIGGPDATQILQGTSMATPHVAGAAALLLQAHPHYRPDQVASVLNQMATTGRMFFWGYDQTSPDRMLYVGPISKPSVMAPPTLVPGDRKVTIKWTPPSNNGNMPITGYRLQVTTDGVNWRTLGTAKGSSRTGTATGLVNGTKYWFRVAAVNFVGMGPDSAPSAVTSPRTVPSALGTVAAQPLNGGVALTWPAPASDGGVAVGSYRIAKSVDGVHWSTITTAAPLTRTFTVKGLTNGARYWFRVAAANVVGPGGYSPPVVVSPRPVASSPGRPTALVGSGRVTLAWTAPLQEGDAPITGYRILRSVNGTTWLLVTANAPLSRSFRATGLVNGVAYQFRVAALNAYGIGAWSAITSATPHA